MENFSRSGQCQRTPWSTFPALNQGTSEARRPVLGPHSGGTAPADAAHRVPEYRSTTSTSAMYLEADPRRRMDRSKSNVPLEPLLVKQPRRSLRRRRHGLPGRAAPPPFRSGKAGVHSIGVSTDGTARRPWRQLRPCGRRKPDLPLLEHRQLLVPALGPVPASCGGLLSPPEPLTLPARYGDRGSAPCPLAELSGCDRQADSPVAGRFRRRRWANPLGVDHGVRADGRGGADRRTPAVPIASAPR